MFRLWPKLKKEQIENIQIDYGIVFANYGHPDVWRIGPTRGGGEFNANKTLRDIEYDGNRGKTKGMQVIDDIDAILKITNLDTSLDNLAIALPYAKYDKANKKITVDKSCLGVIKDDAYLKNLTMFAKTVNNQYKKITIYNAMTENDFVFAAVPKGEGTIAMEVHAHWDDIESDDAIDELFTIEEVASFTNPA